VRHLFRARALGASRSPPSSASESDRWKRSTPRSSAPPGGVATDADALRVRWHPKVQRASRIGTSPGPFRRDCCPACNRCRIPRNRAKRVHRARCAEDVPQPFSGAVDTSYQPHAAAAHAGPSGFGAVLRDHVAELRRNPVERLVPRSPSELATPLRSGSEHWIQQAIGRARIGQVIFDLVAK
jgi:hypothetical protein